ncbi:GcvT family protein [Granulosicoccus antarcticus]|uniref:4-methylaminobutanoate oxidase (Formaldehyde-forming) n=1 Tax=Granulosicoccus antarcticus IMCC3135 TaxID=1192854 RepID=A0A2Z2NMX5_9GAMM|nr:FAD-dependent oxidoreductase [Granulosicoccus antarcticus]ASJ72579.1 4-methylaminobutanoate oxidase (formaldehyde-forming) [Granulosicoccus antarcticus IMCC3135]
MKSQARVVIIGGGVAGTSALYHLAERGWTDCMLLEMDELTSGSTWHAAGNIPTFSSSRNMIKLQHYGTQLYSKLCDNPDYPINYHKTGSIRLAQTRQRMEEFQHVSAMANAMGLDYEILDDQAMKQRHPFLEGHDLLGALWDPHDGDIDPSQLTQAYASHARKAGATIHRFTKVTGISRTSSGEWSVQTDKGDVLAEYVINAGGYRGAEVSQLSEKFLPMVTMEHQYLITESIPELAAIDQRLPLVRDPDDSYYLRQEKSGLILGPYEMKATARWKDGKIPDKFAYELFANDLDRLEWYIEKACERMPILGSVGVQRVINGPIPYSPDGAPYIGPTFGLPNFFQMNGFSFGICQSGGAGKCIAEWIIDGKPEWDLWSLDPRRYTDYADQKYVVDRAIELYQHEYAINFPVEERPAGRPRKVSPSYDRLAAKGARFGARGGWERAVWFARKPNVGDESPSYQRGVWFEAVAEECLNVRDNVGLLDLGGFSKFEVQGEGTSAWLDTLIAGKLPTVGRVSLSYFCADNGGVWSEMTLTRLADEHYMLICGAAAKWHDYQWLDEHLPTDSAIELVDVSDDYGTLVVAGPRAREVLQPMTQTDMSHASFRWLSCQTIQLAGIEVRALRVNYVGELGWELHVKMENQLALYDALMEAGSAFDLQDFGMYAMESMRLEKSYRAWKVDLDHEYSPLRSGLDRFVDLNKPAFKGRDALLAEVSSDLPDIFVTLLLDAGEESSIIENTDALYGCPILVDADIVGYTTSGGYGHRISSSIALGYVKPEFALDGTQVEINVLGHLRKGRVVAESPYDPENKALRS